MTRACAPPSGWTPTFNGSTDAQIATLAIDAGAVVATNDADVVRFCAVATVNPPQL